MTDNTSQQQIDELRAIADAAMRLLASKKNNHTMVKVFDQMTYVDLRNRYDKERESR